MTAKIYDVTVPGRFLLDEYGWQGANWIIAAIILHGVACGLIFRPLEQNRPRRKRHESDPEGPIDHGYIFDKTLETKQRTRLETHHSLDGVLITRDNRFVRNPEEIDRIMMMSANNRAPVANPELAPLNPTDVTRNDKNGSVPNLNGSAGGTQKQNGVSDTPEVVISNSSFDLTPKEESKPKHKQLMRIISTDSPKMPPRKRTTSRDVDIGASGDALTASKMSLRKRQHEVARPMYRADIFYSGSVRNLREYSASGNMEEYVASVTSIPQVPDDEDPDSCRAKCMPALSVLRSMLDFSLLKSPTFSVLCLASVLAMTGDPPHPLSLPSVAGALCKT